MRMWRGRGGAIAQWFAEQELAEAVSLIQLQQALEMPMVEVWMVLVFPQQQYEWEQGAEFYEAQGIWIDSSCASSV